MIADELICPVCLDTFVNPVILKCSHNLCLTCAEQLYSFQILRRAASSSTRSADVAATIKCPVCSALTPLNPEKGIKDLTGNLVLRNVLQEIASGRIKCGGCPKNFAVKDCIQCKASYCSVCLDSWHTCAAFRGHQTTAMGMAKCKKSKTCEKHGEEMKIFCMDDQVLICSHCAIFSAHKTHTCLPLSEAAESMKTVALDLLSRSKKEQAWLFNVQKESSSLARQVQEDSTKVVKGIETYMNSLIGVLESRRDAILKMLQSDMKEKDEIFAQQGVTVTHLLSKAEKLREAEKNAAASPEDFISWTDDMKRFLKSSEEAKSFWTFPKAPCFEMGHDKDNNLLEMSGSLTFPGRLDLPGRPPEADAVSTERSSGNKDEKRLDVRMMKPGPLASHLQVVFKTSMDGLEFDSLRGVYRTFLSDVSSSSQGPSSAAAFINELHSIETQAKGRVEELVDLAMAILPPDTQGKTKSSMRQQARRWAEANCKTKPSVLHINEPTARILEELKSEFENQSGLQNITGQDFLQVLVAKYKFGQAADLQETVIHWQQDASKDREKTFDIKLPSSRKRKTRADEETTHPCVPRSSEWWPYAAQLTQAGFELVFEG